mgnify:CR=1 FL=1|tara:strand:- start:35 stop:547 length:513 start_codon:yes stop_codon:yes gene_type:complete
MAITRLNNNSITSITALPSAVAVASTPAFEGTMGSDTSFSSDTFTKCAINTEVFDTDSCFDSTTNYRFTPTTAGKYFVYGNVYASTGSANMYNHNVAIYKNGSIYRKSYIDWYNNTGSAAAIPICATVVMNGSTDYVELYVKSYDTSGNPSMYRPAEGQASFFGAYRIIE